MAFSSVAGYSFGSVRHTGLYWMLSFVVGLLIIPLKRGKITFPLWAWAPFYLYFAISIFWTRFDLRDNVQFLVQIGVFPIIGIIASYAVKTVDDLNKFRPAYLAATVLIGIFCVYYMYGPGQVHQKALGSVYGGFAERPAAVSLIVVAAMFIANTRNDMRYSLAVWMLCFVISILSQSRMSTFVLLAIWLIHPNFGTIKDRIIPVTLMTIAGWVAFHSPIIQNRFFNREYGYSGSGTIWDVLQGKFDSAGRFDSWPLIFERSFDNFWFGHGIGESPPFVFRVWAPMDKPHNEYLRMFYEGGVIGLGLFVFALIGTLINIIWILNQTKKWNWAPTAAFISWIGLILMAIVDNPLVYGNNFVHIAFFLVGASNGIYANWKQKQEQLEVPLGESDVRVDEYSALESLQPDNTKVTDFDADDIPFTDETRKSHRTPIELDEDSTFKQRKKIMLR